MSTKAQFETVRDNNLGDTAPSSPSTPLRDPVCDRTVFDLIKDEFFGTIYEETETGGVKTTLIASGVTYNVTLQKQGNKVFIKCDLVSSSTIGTGSGDIDLFQINDTELQQKTGKSYYLNSFSFSGTYSNKPMIKIASGKIILVNGWTLTSGARVGFSDFYYTND